MHVPEHFDARKPGVIVVFFHAMARRSNATCVTAAGAAQISDSGANAVLLAPSLRSMPSIPRRQSSGNPAGSALRGRNQPITRPSLWRSGAAKALRHAGHHRRLLRRLLPRPEPGSGRPGNRVRGVFLLDAVYGELDKLPPGSSTTAPAFFVSA